MAHLYKKGRWDGLIVETRVGIYKIFVYFRAGVHESTILFFPPAHLHCPPWCNTIA